MENNQDHIDKIFRDSLESLHESPPANTWKNIAAKLDAEDAKKYKRKFILAKRFGSIILLFLLGLLAVDITNYYFKNSSSTQGQIYRSKSEMLTDSVNLLHPGSDLLRKTKGGVYSRLSISSANNYVEPKSKALLPIRSRHADNKINYFHFFTSGQPGEPQSVAVNTHEAKTNYPVRLSTIQHGSSDSEVIATSEHSIGIKINSSKIIQPAILPIERNSRPFRNPLNFTVFGSAVMARYYLQDDVPENTFAQNTIQNSLQVHPQQINRSTIAHRENPELSFNTGLLVAKDFKKHLGIQTGIIFNKHYISILPQKVYATPDNSGNIAYKLLTSSGYGFVKPGFSNMPSMGDSLYTTNVQHDLQYLTIPILLTYSVSKNRMSESGGLGVSLNFLTSSSIKTELENSTSRETIFISRLQGTRLLHLSLMANAEIKYWLNKNWALDAISSAACAFTPVTKSIVVKTYPYNYSLGLGISYRLN